MLILCHNRRWKQEGGVFQAEGIVHNSTGFLACPTHCDYLGGPLPVALGATDLLLDFQPGLLKHRHGNDLSQQKTQAKRAIFLFKNMFIKCILITFTPFP